MAAFALKAFGKEHWRLIHKAIGLAEENLTGYIGRKYSQNIAW